jgi:cellulose synthase/poly-beta-1,6-N-acetylglucosamine synthase-like glycosyltransferase
MTLEILAYLLAFMLWLLAAVHGLWAFWGGVRFRRYVVSAIRNAPTLLSDEGKFRYQPRAAVILPCRGIDDRLQATAEAVGRQRYGDYEVIFVFESEADPAYSAVGEWIKGWTRTPVRRVVAGLAQGRSQKVHNLLHAVEQAASDREVFVFLDSDAVPGEDWLGYLVAPLQDAGVAAATGYRWYTATGGLASGVRCGWNAATVTLLDDERVNFSWGGATAILRRAFDGLDIRGRWAGSLTDDYPITLAARQAGLRIRFVPQALVPSADGTTLREFWTFARRQLIITKVYVPEIWRAGFAYCLNSVVGGTVAAAAFFVSALGWAGSRATMYAALVGWLAILGLAAGKAFWRQLAVRKLLRPPDWTWRDFCWDVLGVNPSGMLHLGLLLASARSRRFVWRGTRYELLSPTETRILEQASSQA